MPLAGLKPGASFVFIFRRHNAADFLAIYPGFIDFNELGVASDTFTVLKSTENEQL